MMGLKSLPHPRDGCAFLPHRGVAWETAERAEHGPTLLHLEGLQGTPQLRAVKHRGVNPRGRLSAGETLRLLLLWPFSQGMDC